MDGTQEKPKSKIKKLTKEKIQAHLHEFLVKNGQYDLSGRGIESIVSFEGLNKGTKLDLSQNRLTKLTQLQQMKNLTMIKLIGNKLNGEGVAELQYLKKLVTCNVAENQILRISSDILRNMNSLKALVLNNNVITTLEWVPKLPELNALIVSHNRISQITPKLLTRLPSLTKLSISYNLLQECPNLSPLTSLTELRMSHNKLKVVPPGLSHLTQLRILDLGNNLIDTWDSIEPLSQVKSLRQLNLKWNPIYGDPMAYSKNNGLKKGALDGERSEKSAGESDEEVKEPIDVKQIKLLEAKHKQYNFKMKRLFPALVIRDGQRVLDKKSHGYIPKEKHTEDDRIKKTKTNKTKRAKVNKEVHENKLLDPSDEDYIPEDHMEISNVEVLNTNKLEEYSSKEKNILKKAYKNNDMDNTNHSSKKRKKEVSESTDIMADIASTPTDVSSKKTKSKKHTKESKDKKNKSEPSTKDPSSGVLAIRNFAKGKKQKTNNAKNIVDFTIEMMKFQPSVGQGGLSTWDD